AGSAERRQALAVETERRRHDAHQAVDRRALLGAAGEVDAAQERAIFIAGGTEDLIEELLRDLLQCRHLRREAEDQAAAIDIRLLVDALEQPLIEPLLEQLELLVEAGHRPFRALAVVKREGEAPDLLALLL